MAEFTDYDRSRLDEIHSIVTNGLRDTVKDLKTQYSELNVVVKKTIEYIGSDAWHDEHCPILKERRKRRKSWDWYLVLGVAASSIIMNVVTVIAFVFGAG